jgi:hypothetical protein
MNEILIYMHERLQTWLCMVAHTIILATWEAEIRRIKFLGQPGKKAQETPSWKKKKPGVVLCACHPNQKLSKAKRAGSVAQVVGIEQVELPV